MFTIVCVISVGPVMTGLGPSLRRLPSGDPKSGPGATGGASDGKPDGSSDAGDSLDGQTSGMALTVTITVIVTVTVTVTVAVTVYVDFMLAVMYCMHNCMHELYTRRALLLVCWTLSKCRKCLAIAEGNCNVTMVTEWSYSSASASCRSIASVVYLESDTATNVSVTTSAFWNAQLQLRYSLSAAQHSLWCAFSVSGLKSVHVAFLS